MITLYSKPNCIHCEKAKSFLKRHKIDFETVDVTQDDAALAMLKSRGLLTVPQVFYQGQLAIEGGYEGLLRAGADQVRAVTA